MTFFGLGIWEIVFILLIVLIVVGPERLPGLARQLGLLVAQVQGWLQRSPDAQMIMQARRELEREIGNLRSELVAMQQAQKQLVASAQQAINEPLAALKAAQEEISADLKQIGAAVEAPASTSAATLPETTLLDGASDALPESILPEAALDVLPETTLSEVALPETTLSEAALDALPDAALPDTTSNVVSVAPELRAVPRSSATNGLGQPAPLHVPEMPPLPSALAETLHEEAGEVAELAEQAQALTLSMQVDQLALRLQTLANELAALQTQLRNQAETSQPPASAEQLDEPMISSAQGQEQV